MAGGGTVVYETLSIPAITLGGSADLVHPIYTETLSIPAITLGGSVGDTNLLFEIGEVRNIYLCYLTGDQNGLDSLLLPISSFQCTLRTETQSYMQVVTPAIDYASEIAARADGNIRVIMCREKNGEIINQEQIASVAMDYVSSYEGTVNKSVVLSGHSTFSSVTPATVTLENVSYKSVANGKIILRIPEPNFYLRPGDTVVHEDDTFTADKIVMYMSVVRQQVEVSSE